MKFGDTDHCDNPDSLAISSLNDAGIVGFFGPNVGSVHLSHDLGLLFLLTSKQTYSLLAPSPKNESLEIRRCGHEG